MNRKVLGIAFALLLAAMFVAPVFAKTKVAVTATQMGGSSEGESWLVDHGIYQFRGAIGAGMVTLNIPGQPPLIGTSSSVVNGKITFEHPEPGPWLEAVGIMHLKMVWTFTGEGTTGTFEGQMNRKGIGMPMTYIEAHMVLQGTGDFEGQTLMLSYAGPPPLNWEGFLLTS
jgi:hypothetical protein